jgi:hypothetical protein
MNLERVPRETLLTRLDEANDNTPNRGRHGASRTSGGSRVSTSRVLLEELQAPAP